MDLRKLQHQNSGLKKSQSRQIKSQTSSHTSSNISHPLDGLNQSNLLVDPEEIQKIFREIQKQKQRKQG